ncbi:hypothetical protein UFOVP49_3 [uncultured Caudovirales phage]|uniref:Uncharacterized protein n=1 Tax=uncultured Caudovirales phage TaxID=2100421 RepID=A0A6J5KS50_9CAUD|nr:hypothetical protein UFOVP49_3 [uncultured Caudovirales phage]
MGAYTDLSIDQGTDFETTLDLTADDGTAINVAGYVFSGQIRKSYYSTNPTANLILYVTDSSNGNVLVTLDADITSNIAAGRYVYDIKMKDTANNTTRVVEGIITVTPQVCRL